MAKTRFQLRPSYCSGERLILLVISHRRQEYFASTGITIKPSELSKGSIRFKQQLNIAQQYNNRLDEIESKVKEIFRTFQFSNHLFTLDQVVTEFEQWFKPDKNKIVKGDWKQAFDAWLRFMEHEQKLSAGTIRSKKVLRSVIEDSGLTKDMFTEKRLDHFLNYMIDSRCYEGEVVQKKLVNLKEFVKFAKLPDAIVTWKPKRKIESMAKEAISVLPAEYAALKKATGLSSHLEKIRDIAIVLYNTGQHHADTCLKASDVYNGNINGFRRKTGNRFIVPVTPDLQAILDKYSGSVPFMSNQKTNDGLKELWKFLVDSGQIKDRQVRVESAPGGKRKSEMVWMSGIISSKIIGRNSFATRMAAASIDPSAIAKAMGHTNTRQQDIYKADTPELQELMRLAITGG